MITLAFDSVAKIASVAVSDGERLLAQYSIDNGLTQSELLLPMAEDILKSLKLGFEDVKLLACTTGPGSFTGVRIGAALVKGLAFGKNIPCVGVSALESLAQNLSPLKGILVPCMDARRSQLYTAIFKSENGELKRLTDDAAMSFSDLAELLKKYDGENIYLSGDGYNVAKAALIKEGIALCETPPLLIPENAYSCAVVATKKYERGEFTDDRSLAPTYLRMPQAERERLEKEKSNIN